MAEKKTSNMLIRDIPIDIWERIDKLCRRQNLKRRDFVEQALRFFEGDKVETDRIQRESSQITAEIDESESEVEDFEMEVEMDHDIHKVERKIDRSSQKNRVSIQQIKPERSGNLALNLPDSGIGAQPLPERNQGVITTVFCWGLDRADNSF